MKFDEVRRQILKILSGNKQLKTAEIAKQLGYDSPTWTNYVLNIMKIHGDVRNISSNRICIWAK